MLLAVDSSNESLRLGLAEGECVLAEYNGPPDRSHSEKLLPEIDKLMAMAGIRPEQLEALALVIGPGSFTGLRVGAAALMGLAQAWHKPILTAKPHLLYRLWLKSESPSPVIAIHCRADQFFISANSQAIAVETLAEIIGYRREARFAGPGAERLVREARKRGPGYELKLREPATCSGGELALLFGAHREDFEQLDPLAVDLNYLVRSQPERLAEQAEPPITIGELKESDLDQVLEIEAASFTDAWSRKAFESDINNKLIITLAVRQGQKCIGYLDCLAVDNYGYIANIAVTAEARSRGIGRALLDELCYRLRRRNKFLILLDVRVSNHGAISFYERYGFTILVQRSDFYSHPVEDSYTMSLEMKV
ncbi:MAG: ribosomal protein S18-alanine N-acetyltransferase [bacterium]